MPGGRPTKFSKGMQRKIKVLARRGFTDKEIATVLGVTEQTINNWKIKHPKFFESLKDWKAEADEKVEVSLYERACGYSHPETKAQWVESFVEHDETYIKVGRWEYAELIRHYPPDPTSMIFWLKNRQAAKWRDKTEVEHGLSEKAMSLAVQVFQGRKK